MHMASAKLANCQTGLKRWSGHKFGQFDCVLKEIRKQLEVLHRDESSDKLRAIKESQDEIIYSGARGCEVETEGKTKLVSTW